MQWQLRWQVAECVQRMPQDWTSPHIGDGEPAEAVKLEGSQSWCRRGGPMHLWRAGTAFPGGVTGAREPTPGLVPAAFVAVNSKRI